MKRVLFLGGAYAQIPIIEEAKNRGWYIITCDYLPENPGHKLANEYYNVSTTDFDGVLELAKKVKADYVIAYASDPAAQTAAYVSEKLNLPSNSYESIKLLSEKDLFRNLLKGNGLNCPQSYSIKNIEELKILEDLNFPFIVKPTDSSGSKGVTKVENPSQLLSAYSFALSYSRNKRVIIEEFIDNNLGDIHGDGFVLNGELAFCCLGDHIYNSKTNPFNPTGTSWPSKHTTKELDFIKEDVSKIIKLANYRNGPINIEARINSKGESFIMEIGPRNGGHFVPQAIKIATSFDMVKALLDLYQFGTTVIPNNIQIKSTAYTAIHSEFEGKLENIIIDSKLEPFIKEFHQYIKKGETVQSFKGANAAIGILLLKFVNNNEQQKTISNINNLVKIQIT